MFHAASKYLIAFSIPHFSSPVGNPPEPYEEFKISEIHRFGLDKCVYKM